MILEGIVTTINDDGTTNIAPMGPSVDESWRTLRLRPFRTATTYHNLKRAGEGVFHVTDDVELLARAAVGQCDPPPKLIPAPSIEGRIIADACRWYAFRVRSIDESQQRSDILVDIIDQGRIRDFFGFNRAKHAVVEAAILATRIGILPPEEIQAEFARLEIIVHKTAGPAEQRAFEFLQQYVQRAAGVMPAGKQDR